MYVSPVESVTCHSVFGGAGWGPAMNHYGELQSSAPTLGSAPLQTGIAQDAGQDKLDEQLRIHEYERQRLGQELHDGAAQLLVSLQLSVAHLAETREATEHETVIQEIRETVSQIDHEIRSLAFLDYPAELGSRGLCSAVQSLVNGFSRRTGIRATFKCVGDGSGLPSPIEVAMLRVVQEALANIYRHAHASCARVLLERRPDELRLTIADNGVGIKVIRRVGTSPGIGLQGMRRRIESIGGRFHLTGLRQGTRISASVPLTA